MSDLLSDLIKLAHTTPEARKHLMPLIRVAARGRLPKSKYDGLPVHLRPFGWSDPAPLPDSTVPAPWRVAKADNAKSWLRSVFPRNTDLYVNHVSVRSGAPAQLWVGLRDNQDKFAHQDRIMGMFDTLQSMGFPVTRGGSGSYLLLSDDLGKKAVAGQGQKSAMRPLRWVDMDGNRFDIGSRVAYWRNGGRVWWATVIGFKGQDLLVGGNRGEDPVQLTPEEVAKHIRVDRG